MALTPINLGIQTRLTAGIALVASLLVLAVGWYWTTHEEAELMAGLRQREARMAGLIERGFAGPIWNLDHVAIENLLDAVMADPEVHAIELKGLGLRGGQARRSRDTSASGSSTGQLRREFNITYQPAADTAGTQVASAVLVFTRDLIDEQIQRTRLFVVELLAVVVVGIVIASSLLVHWLVRRPVARLGGLAQRVAKGDLGAQETVERGDEIGELTMRFNAMSLKLRSAADQVQLSSEGLRVSEARYRSLFENATEGVFQADADGRVLSMNRAFTQMLGLGSQSPVGRLLRDLTGIERDELRRVAAVMNEQGKIQQCQLQLRACGGRPLWVELNAHWVEGEGGQRRIEGMVSDISLRRQAEAELTRHRDHLEELVNERTAELSEAKLRAESANQAKGRFLATMSHEFRTPLNAILGFTQLMQMDAAIPANQQAKLQLMRDSGLHLLELINDVLDMASIEAGKVSLKSAPVDLRALVDMACDSVRLRAEQKGLSFAVDVDARLPATVVADGQRLRQVLLNLLSNAVKFTDSGNVQLATRVVELDALHTRLRFEVTDSGIGMTPAQQARLFQAFEQVSDASRHLGGTGLGLSISQQLVRLMGSQILVQSTAGQGSSFVFELRLPLA
ncbi:PAS domain S-box-containing protein [Pelomonas saccharophila]|uniref:histidine kinase n=1 Tax=Roseateles saccharophilus TaxID=304 RepID=A0ABU1YLF5_ROSSA|nr:ATP-binding protein [Roseateles saccharophilus]MDR7269682.1 PAS domain S-box-containing protein [Roseateles saccharophilus]